MEPLWTPCEPLRNINNHHGPLTEPQISIMELSQTPHRTSINLAEPSCGPLVKPPKQKTINIYIIHVTCSIASNQITQMPDGTTTELSQNLSNPHTTIMEPLQNITNNFKRDWHKIPKTAINIFTKYWIHTERTDRSPRLNNAL